MTTTADDFARHRQKVRDQGFRVTPYRVGLVAGEEYRAAMMAWKEAMVARANDPMANPADPRVDEPPTEPRCGYLRFEAKKQWARGVAWAVTG